VAGLAAEAWPGAPVQHRDYLRLRDELLDALRSAQPVAAVLLDLHGAMISTECMDCEGDLLRHVRDIVGPSTPVGAVLDPHAHLTSAMVESASALVFLKEYPHVDGIERRREVLRLLFAMLDGAPAPTPAVFDCRLIGIFPTGVQPMRGFVDRLCARERQPGVLSISFVHGFPWGDTQDTGAKVLVYTRDDAALAARVAREVHEDLWAIRDQVMPPMVSIDAALQVLAGGVEGPLVMADVADNPGGGAPSDSTFVLRALIDAGVRDVAIGMLFDPEAVQACHQVGVGGRLALRVGGKISRFSGEPVDLDVEVRAIAKAATMDVMGQAEFAMGDTAWVHSQGLDLVLGSIRVQTYAPSAFSHLGLDPAARAAVVVKSSTHFQAAFAGIAKGILLVTSPGALNFDFAQLTYRVFDRPFHPRDRVSFPD
jgi:microcystin degradation protein MlrC